MRGLLVAIMLWLALPVAAQDLKLVPQTLGLRAFDAAGWTPDGRWLLTASGPERLLRIWDPTQGENGTIVDLVRLPLPGRRPDEKLEMVGVRVAPDGRSAIVETVLGSEDLAIGEMEHEAIDYAVDLVSRRAQFRPTTRSLEEGEAAIPGEGEVPDVDAGLPVLPAASDGRRLVRADNGTLDVVGTDGKVLKTLSGDDPVATDWVSMSPDGQVALFLSRGDEDDRIALLEEEPITAEEKARPELMQREVTRVVTFDIAKGSYSQPERVWGRYSRAGWLGPRMIVMSEGSSPFHREARHYPDAKGPPEKGLILDLTGEARWWELDPSCYLQPLGRDGRLVGAGLSACRHDVPEDAAIWISTPDQSEWATLPVKLPRNVTVDGLRASPDGKLLAISVGRRGKAVGFLLVDSITGDEVDALDVSGPMITAFEFLPNSRSLVVIEMGKAVHWRFAEGRVEQLASTETDPSLMASDGRILLFGGEMSAQVQRVALDGRGALPSVEGVGPVSGGYLASHRLFWVGTADGELKLYDGETQALIATVERYRNRIDDYFLVHDPAGRYDTNLAPDYAPFRWLVMDAPFQSLSPQTFMRELYTPDLLGRLMACWPTRSCDKALPVALDVGAMNRTLPEVASIDVTAGAAPGTVDVKVTVAEGVNELPSAAYYRARSGMHNLRLFRNGALVAEAGAPDPAIAPTDRAGWRAATRLAPNQADGTHVTVFRGIKLASGPPDGPITFSAYAFNEDRVRGEEVEQAIEMPELIKLARAVALPRPRRLFLVSIGVDAYPGGLFRPLRYAVADARAMAELFSGASVPDKKEMGRPPLQLVPIRVEGTAKKPATRAMIAEAFARLREATPDDMVVVSFSGHGYTDQKGRFSLVPSDVRTEGDIPVRESMIAAEDLAAWLMPVDAGAIHLIVDACHSAASVQSGGFKPGPMGDPGLGQLAYDKGIRILSASAPDQYAMEDTALGHGLLTYALVEEGARQGLADADDNKVVTFDELTAYAVARLPEMGDPTDPDDGPGLVVEWDGPPAARQTPKLFDFAADWSPLVVRDIVKELSSAMEKVTARP